MTTNRCLGLLAALLLLGQPSPALCQPASLMEAEQVRAFADYLYRANDYERAATEYQRYLFLADAYAPSVRMRLGRSYLLLGRPDLARAQFLFSAQAAPRATQRDSALVDALATSLLSDATQADGPTPASELAPETAWGQASAAHVHVLDAMLATAWSRAALLMEADALSPPPPVVAARHEALFQLLAEAESAPQKSPVAAGLLSALVPGAGKAYAGYWIDGVYSFVLIGSNAWLSYEGFRDAGTSSLKGWAFGALGVGLYLGNIYGSVVAADLFNDRVRASLHADVSEQLRLVLRL